VVRTDLAATLALDGTLGFGNERPVRSDGDGRVTWLPTIGTVLSRGDTIFRVDDRPVTLFYGTTPMFRPLDTAGLVGRDIRMLADNLRALGYNVGSQPAVGTTVTQPRAAATAGAADPSASPSGPRLSIKIQEGDAVLTATLVTAVKRWQGQRGLPQTGVVRTGDVVVLSQQVRISAVIAQLGDAANAPLVSVAATTKVITVEVHAIEADSVKSAQSVTVSLPDGSTTPGRLLDVSRVATAGGSDPGGSPGQSQLTATIALDDPNAVRSLDSAPVRVQFATQTRHGVLAVPVGALLALSEGGYALQTDQNTLIRVTVGLFAKGMVEVSGSGLREGTQVVTTS
jgi:peptidoglycan hydrolase-like protein with peptidoglycan-binding domain